MSVSLCDSAKAIRLRHGALSGAVLAVLIAGVPGPGNAGGLPRDPQRPFTAQTCDEAQARLAEAEAGSPLISAREMAGVVEAAQRQAARLCPAEPDN